MTHDRQVVASLALTERGSFDVYCFLLRKTYSRSLSKHDRVCIAAYLRGSTLLFVLRLRNKLVHRATEFALHGEVFLAGKACRHPMNAAFIAASASGAFLIQPAANDLADARVALPQCDPSFGSVSGAALTYDAMAFLFADSLYTCGGAFPALGHGRFVESKHLARVQAFRGKRVRQVALGAGHCAVICDDHLYTFGCGEDGQLGHGDCKTQLLPLRVQNSAMVGVQRVACGELHTVVMWTDHVAVFGNGVALMPCKIDSLQGHQMIDVAAGGRCTAVATAAGVYVLDAAFRQLHRVNGVASVLAIPGCVQFLGCPVDADEATIVAFTHDGLLQTFTCHASHAGGNLPQQHEAPHWRRRTVAKCVDPTALCSSSQYVIIAGRALQLHGFDPAPPESDGASPLASSAASSAPSQPSPNSGAPDHHNAASTALTQCLPHSAL